MKKLWVLCFLMIPLINHAQDMDFKKLKLVLAKEAVIVQESGNVVIYELNGVKIYLITDENANRMRLMAGIIETGELTKKDMSTLMEANYDRALDAKYAISDEVLWAVYVHPLQELYEKQIVDALYQVFALVKNYGTSYTSTDMIFGGDN